MIETKLKGYMQEDKQRAIPFTYILKEYYTAHPNRLRGLDKTSQDEIKIRWEACYLNNLRTNIVRIQEQKSIERKELFENNPERYRAYQGHMRYSLKNRKGGKHWETLVDYTLTELIKNIESKWKHRMTWDNYGMHGWQIDHIIPINAFNFESVNDIDFRKCWALDNLQPLWRTDNIKKGKKLKKDFQPSLALGM